MQEQKRPLWDPYHPIGAHPYRDRYTGYIRFVSPDQPIEDHPLGYFDNPNGHLVNPTPTYAWDDIPPEVWEVANALNREKGRRVDFYQMQRPRRDPDYCPHEMPYRDRYTGKIRIIIPDEPIGRYPLGHFDEPGPPGPRGESIYRWDDIPTGWSPDAPGDDTVSPRCRDSKRIGVNWSPDAETATQTLKDEQLCLF